MTSGRGAGRSVGRPAQISRDSIFDAVAAAENVDTLTMRDVASRLGVSHAALYRWVKDRHALFDLISDVLVARIVEPDGPVTGMWREHLGSLAVRMRVSFLGIPGFATHLSRPHSHNAHSVDRLRGEVIRIFRAAGVDPAMAEQSWYIFITAMVGWLALEENATGLGTEAPQFDLFLAVLLRGLPAEPQP